MRFHQDGYVTSDPRVEPPSGFGIDRPIELPDRVDVLIVGHGPAGAIAAAQLAQFGDIHTRVIDSRPERLARGQADGVQARTVETFQAFGFAPQIVQEAYRITETAFWSPDPQDPTRIARAIVAPDDPSGISEFPHIVVNQARVIDYFADFARNSPARVEPDYGIEFIDLAIDGSHEYPVEVTVRHHAGPRRGETRTIRARYVLGADGARSGVRRSIGCALVGRSANHAWGVIDALADTDFPDARTKCAIQSDRGSMLIIPREGGLLNRWYVDLGEVAEDDDGHVRSTSIPQTIHRANEILHPFTLDVKHVAWSSVYEVGHRISERFDDVPAPDRAERSPRVFIAGDACHTHSAKAGQGMNVSMQDGWNFAWKVSQVLRGLSPSSILSTYSDERRVVAEELIDFDRRWSSLMATRPEDMSDPRELADFYMRTAEFPAGFMTQYAPSVLIGSSPHHDLATGFPRGKRFKSELVARVADGNPIHLGHGHRADGRWRLYVFADHAPGGESRALSQLSAWLMTSPASVIRRYSPAGADLDVLFDISVIYQQTHDGVEFSRVPPVFLPRVGEYRVMDRSKVLGTTSDVDIFASRGVSRGGAIVIVRPDQYVAEVLPLSGVDELGAFFAPIFQDQAVAQQHPRPLMKEPQA